MVRQYTQLWPSSVVVVTGTTGNLGGVLLSMLVQDERVRRVYAINRPSSRTGADGHAALFEERGLDKSLVASPKVVFLEAQLHHEHLGLGEKVYDEVPPVPVRIVSPILMATRPSSSPR
jgi:thioester reductase-like protein